MMLQDCPVDAWSSSKLVNTFRGPGGDLASESFSDDEVLGLDDLYHSKLELEVADNRERRGVVL